MAIEPASNGADGPTNGSVNGAVPESEAHRPRPADTAAWTPAAAGSADRDRLRSPQVALNRGINAFNAFNRAEEEAVSTQNEAAEAYSDLETPSRPYPDQKSTQQTVSYPDTSHPAVGTSQQDSLRSYSRKNAYSGVPPALEQRRRDTSSDAQLDPPVDPALASPLAPESGQYVINPLDGSAIFVPAQPQPLAWWEKQPYYAIAHALAVGGTLTAAWLLGILAAQVLPGNVQQPPFQEAVLRKTSRLTRRLWNVPQLWQTPTAETRIEAIPLPETGPILAPISLPPIEKQPLVDELNAIETEILTLDRRMQTLEKRLGKPPYEGADVESRVKALRSAIDPPVRSSQSQVDAYKPVPIDPNDRLLDVAKLKVTLPSDALFSPGQSELKNTLIQDQVLNQVLDQLVNYPRATIVVSSYSDSQAKRADAQAYTLAQANALSVYLQASLPSGYRWVTVGGGQARPVASNAEDMGRQRNRRIEIVVDTRSRT